MNSKLNYHINQIKKNGFVKLDRFLAKKTTQQLKDLVNFNYKKYTGKEFTGTPDRVTDDKMVYNLQNKNYTFIKLITSRNVVEIAKYFLNDPYYRFIDNKYPNYNLLYFNARSSGKKLDLHIDSHIPFTGKLTNMMQFVFLLEDSTIDNGCTIVVKKSHKSGKFTDRKSKKIIPLNGKAGDLLIWDSRLWHGTFENNSKLSRWAIVATFGAWWIKPSMNITRSLPNTIYKKCNNMQKQILGFCSIPPKDEHDRINTKCGYSFIKKNVQDYY